MKIQSAVLGIAMLGTGQAIAIDVSGHVYDKLGKPLAAAKVCAQGGSACVSSAADGAFHFTGSTGALAEAASGGGYSLRYVSGRLTLEAAASVPATLEWFDAGGRRLAAPVTARLTRGALALDPPGTGEGIRFLRLSASGSVRTWKILSGFPGGMISESDAAGAPLPKASAAFGALEASKDGYRSNVYYPSADNETGALISLANPGDSVLFDGKALGNWDFLAANWSVKNGNVAGNSDGNFGGTFIASKSVFKSFRLTVTERLVSGSHLGLCVWGKVTGPNNGGAGQCLVVIPPAGAMWDYGKGAIKGAGVGKAGVSASQWHQVELLAKGGTGEILAACNGVQITYYKDGNPSRFNAAPIRLQLHANNGPQEMLYRDVVVEPDPKDDKLLSVK
jgi:hypothetical protein